MAVTAGLFVALCVSYLALFTRGKWLLNPVPIFIAIQLVMFLGTLPLLDDANPADLAHLSVLCLGMASFMGGAILMAATKMGARRRREDWWSAPVLVEVSPRFRSALLFTLLVSALISGLYYYLVGYNVFLLAIRAMLSGAGPLEDVTSLRLQAYSSERYLAPGYVNQFKNILLPLIVEYFAIRYFIARRLRDGVLAMASAPVAITSLLGTGQRMAFMVAGLILVVFANAALPKRATRRLNVTAAVVLPLFIALSTVILGRSVSQLSSVKDVAAVGAELISRISYDQQIGSVVGFRYLARLPVEYGQEWFADLAGVLPGQPGSSLAHDVSGLLFGNTRGTAPVSLWVSIWHNFRWAGILIIPAIIGALYEGLYHRLFSGTKSLFRLLTYASLSVILGLWVAGSPATLINTGALTVVLFHVFTRSWQRRLVPPSAGVRTSPKIVDPRSLDPRDWLQDSRMGRIKSRSSRN